MTTFRKVVAARSVDDLADAGELSTVVSRLLTEAPLDEQALRCAVWNFVGVERRADVPASLVIARLTDLIDQAPISPFAARAPLTRRVILWCVEEYFGHLGGDALAMDASRGEALSPARG
jgi:hypothetical protein